MNKLKIGVIGAGHMGLYHINVLSSLNGETNGKIRLVGISDISEEKAKKIGEKYNIPYYTNNDELLKKVDAVCIATPTNLHYETVMLALERNVNILVEKPITDNLDKAKEMVEFAKKKKLTLQVGHLERFRGTTNGIKQLINNPYLIEAKRLQTKNNRIMDVGVVLDLMIHDIDLIHLLLQSEVDKISAFGRSVYTDFEDFAKVTLLFKNGCIVELTASRISQDRTRTLEIYQEDSDILLNYLKDEISIHKKSQIDYEVDKKELKYHERMVIENLYIHTDNPLKNEIFHFIDCIKGKQKSIVSDEWDIKTLKLTLKILDLLKENTIQHYANE